jgi:hypothetical protein
MSEGNATHRIYISGPNRFHQVIDMLKAKGEPVVLVRITSTAGVLDTSEAGAKFITGQGNK